jgi:hypothetical protein
LQRFGQIFLIDVTALHFMTNVQGGHAGIVDKLVPGPSSALLAVKVNALLKARSQTAAYRFRVVVVAVLSHVVFVF